MDYFSILQLEKEPFSNSPDPAFFFKSRQHQDCLQKIELALRLKRGLNVVMGDVGTGKTTLCRQLIRRFREDGAVDTHLILDPGFDTPVEFLATVAGLLSGETIPGEADAWQLKERIKNTLYRRGVDEGRTVILIFDEGQKLPPFAIELLREFLNYETNTEKLLQIAIFAQCEFEAILKTHANFADRVNLLHHLDPMSFRDTREMIRFRLRQSSTSPRPVPLFTYPAMWAIYRFSRGYPRKIINLCHQSLLAMIIQNRTKAGLMLVRSCVQRAIGQPGRRLWRPLTPLLLVLLLVVAVGALLPEPYSPLSHLASGLGSRPWVSVHPVSDREPSPMSTRDSDGKGADERAREISPLQTAAAQPSPPELTTLPETEISTEGHPIGDAAYMDDPVAVAPPDRLPPAVAPPDEPRSGGGDVGAAKKRPAPLKPDRQAEHGGGGAGAGLPASWTQTTATGATPTNNHPLLLGRLQVRSGDTLVRLVRQVRGNYDPKYMDSLLALNPHIKNPDSIAVDDEIIFPASPVKVSPLIARTHWLQLSERPRLDEAHQEVTAYRDLGISVHLVPYWTALMGLRFVVLAAEAHASPEAAHSKLATLPGAVAAHSRVRSQWGQDPVFFASPF